MIPRNAAGLLPLLALLALAGCGRQAMLERPRPLTGHPFTPNAEALTREQAANRALRDGAVGADPQAPQSVEEVRDQGRTIQPWHAAPGSTTEPPPPGPPAPP